MNFDVKYGPANALGVISLEQGEQVQAVTGAMVSMSAGITIDTGMKGGLVAGLKRSVLGGESLFINTFTAQQPGEVTVSPPLPGDMVAIKLSAQDLYVHSGAFLAASAEVNVDTKWGGGRTFFSGEGLFLVKLSGPGTVLVSSYGAIDVRELAPSESYTVDTAHIVGFEGSVQYDVQRSGGWKTTMLGGEGLVVDLTGPGRIFIQTRSPQSLVEWLIPQLPRTQTND
jgi:uncharacterized protein (TIGR00266 family)